MMLKMRKELVNWNHKTRDKIIQAYKDNGKEALLKEPFASLILSGENDEQK